MAECCSSGVVGLDAGETEALDPGSLRESDCRRVPCDRGLEPVVRIVIERRELGPGSKRRSIWLEGSDNDWLCWGVLPMELRRWSREAETVWERVGCEFPNAKRFSWRSTTTLVRELRALPRDSD